MGRGKKTNRLYITRNEWINDFAGKRDNTDTRGIRGIPFHYCHLTLKPFVTPVCTTHRKRVYLFDLEAIADYISDYGVHPVTGEPLKTKDLKRLHLHKNESGKYMCPVLQKEFTEHSHIVAVGPTGNVFSFEAVDEMNIKRRHWKDLLTDETFKKKDLLTIQDPQLPQDIRWTDYFHVKKSKEEELEEYEKKTAHTVPKKEETSGEKKYDGGFTCAGFSAAPQKEISEAEKPGIIVKEKGYVQLETTLGMINLELHCDLAPKTCQNFIELCKSDYYNDTLFHRNIPGFMIQGGDPTGTGRGGSSIWKEKFFDEFKQQIPHNKRGVLSMANSGPKTNGSQFFILYEEQKHLNYKHTVFGQVVGGMDTLDKMEASSTEKERPVEDIKISGATIFKDPFADLLEAKANEHITQKLAADSKQVGQWYSNPKGSESQEYKSGVGKYINPSKDGTAKRSRAALDFGVISSEARVKKKPKTEFNW